MRKRFQDTVRTPFHKIPQGDFIDDCRLNASQACVLYILGSFWYLSFIKMLVYDSGMKIGHMLLKIFA